MYTDVLVLGSTELNKSCLCGQAAGFCLLLLPPCVHALQAIAGPSPTHPSSRWCTCCLCRCYVISAHQMLLGQPGIGRVIRDHQCADCCDELEPCLTGALKQTVAAQLEGCTTIDAVAAALGTSVTRDAKTGKLCSDDAGGQGPAHHCTPQTCLCSHCS